MNESDNPSAVSPFRRGRSHFESHGCHVVAVWCALMFLPMIPNSQAASPAEEKKRVLAEVEPRIRAIYERREFRAAEVSAEWLPDSSGYRIQERDPKTNELIQVNYEVRTGQPIKEATRKDTQEAHQPSVSPDGKWILEFKDRVVLFR